MTRTAGPNSAPSPPLPDGGQPPRGGVPQGGLPLRVGTGLDVPAVEPKPAPGSPPTAEDLFLSPRVVDRRTFEQFGTLLMDLARQAEASRDALASAVEHSSAADARLRETLRQLQSRAEAAAKAIPLIDKRLARLDEFLTLPTELLAQQRSKMLERARAELAREVDAAAAQHAEQAIARVKDQIASAIDARLREAVDAALSPAIARAEQTAALLDRLATEGEQRLAQIIDTAQRQSEDARAALADDAQSQSAKLTASVSRSFAALMKAEERATALAATLRERTQQGESVAARLGEIDAAEIASALERIAPGLERLGDVTKLESALAAAAEAAPALASAEARLASLREQAELARTLLGKSIVEGAHAVDALEKRAMDAGERLRAAVDAAPEPAPAGPPAIDVEAALRMGQWLAEVVNHARATGTDLSASGDQLASLADRLESIADRLEPWRRLVESADAPRVPEALRTLLAQRRTAG